MSRTRQRTNAALPKYVYRRSYGYILRPYLGMVAGVRQYGKDINLCPADAPLAAVWLAYERETKTEKDTLAWLLSEYHAGAKFKALKPRSQENYEYYQKLLLAYPMANGKPFGGARLVSIKRTGIQKFLDKYPSPTMANRLVQYIKAAWNWALNRYENLPENPCVGVDLNKQTARSRYVSQTEFHQFKATCPTYVGLFMELAYLCRARWNEVASLKTSDIAEAGLRLVRSKGSEGEHTAWTDRLRTVVEHCQAYNAGAPTPLTGGYLVHNKCGKAINQNAFQTAWGRAMRAWVAAGNERFTFHDLKAAGYSDQKVQDAGHRSEKMHKTYNRKLRTITPAE